jgi:hypothetical protein
MMITLSPYFIAIPVLLGAFLSPILGWARAYLNSKATVKALEPGETSPGGLEQMDWKKVMASTIIGLVAALLFLGQYSGAVSIGLPDLEIALIAGFGADKIVKNLIGL